MSETELKTIFTVSRIAYTAGAKRAVGYGPVTFEFVATTESDAIEQAIRQCRWDRPRDNFRWFVDGSRIVEIAKQQEVSHDH